MACGDLAKVETIEHASEVLHRNLPRFDEQFGIPATQSEVAYRKPPTAAAVEQALCFRFHCKVARDNTVRHRRRTLQLLPGMERTSYAGAQVEVLGRPDGRLLVEYQGGLIATQEAPPRPGLLRVLGNRTTPDGRANGSGHSHHELSSLEKTDVDSERAASPRPIAACDRQGVGHPQEYRPQIRTCQEPAHEHTRQASRSPNR